MTRKSVIFGPVLSRRLGYSLGIDLLPPKTCNMDCIYCEVGRTNFLTEERQTFVDFFQVIREIRECPHEIDYLTITGSGEPTLHMNLDTLIHRLKEKFEYPVVLITNSLLLRHSDVRRELLELDIIMPSMDAVTQPVFQTINQPVVPIQVEEVIDGLMAFRQEFSGKIWLEILLVKGVNDNENELRKMKQAIKRIEPDKVQLNTVARPPAYRTKAVALSMDELKQAASIIDHPCLEILGESVNAKEGLMLTENELLGYLARRPASFEELSRLFKNHPREIRELLASLLKAEKIKKELYEHEVHFR